MRFLLFCSLTVSVLCNAQPILEEGFARPPAQHRPQVWWWFNAGPAAPNEAITRDLEGLARVGVSGFHIYGGSATNPKWLAKAKWALREAHRLGLDGVVCIGAAGCGHAETDPRHAQKDVVFTSTTAKGGAPICVKLPKKRAAHTPKNADGSPKYYWDVAVLAVPHAKDFVPVSAVRDVTRFFDPKTGELVWNEAPAGEWRILRVGFAPKVFGWMGCYIDHMSRAAFDAHWARVMDPLLAALTKDERSALKAVMCDSWEAGTVSWTDTFPAEFRTRRGYDILPWLPAKAGVRLESLGKMSRFLRDFDETVSELIAENHYAYQKEVANRHGLQSIAEAAGPHQKQGDVRRMQGRCDVAMGEFWMPSGHRPAPEQRFMVRDAANAAHVYGLNEVLAEAFTTINTYWIESPETMKPCADRAFCDGLTRVCYHGMMLSPSLTERPGLIRNVGTHYNPQTTWFEQSRALNLYLSRCSWMLSQGRFAADALLYAGDAVGVFAGMKTPTDGLGVGYDYDICPTELLLQARVENGEIVLPSGARYKTLMFSTRSPAARSNLDPGKREIKSFPPVEHFVGEAAMLKLRELVEAGATLVGKRPSGPTSMNESSARYHAAADALWGARGSVQSASRMVGKGRVLRDATGVCATLPPDFSVVGNTAAIDWIHRSTPQHEIYFLSNQRETPCAFTGCFRVAATRAELWDPVTGIRRGVRVDAGKVQIRLPKYGSVFVVFGNTCRDPEAEPAPRVLQTVTGPWTVQFDSAWGGPKDPVQLKDLKDWTSFDDPGIRNYSGTAVYRTTFDATAMAGTAWLDLGTVDAVAEVVLNGRNLGIAWTSPFALPVDGALRVKGNELEIRVTNLWPNRLIGDAGLPKDKRVTRTNINPYKPTDALLPSGLLGPVTLQCR